MFNRICMLVLMALSVTMGIHINAVHAEVLQEQRDAALADWKKLVEQRKRLEKEFFDQIAVIYNVDEKTIALIESFQSKELPVLKKMLDDYAKTYGQDA